MKNKSINKLIIPLLIFIPFVTSVLPRYYNIESSRTINLVVSGEVSTHDSGRYDIYQIVERKILERPITGWGIGSDRAFIDTYSHNIFLELALHYGVFMAFFLLLALLLILIKGLNPMKSQKIGGWIYLIMMSFYGFVPLMFSNSYLIDYKFATFLGVLFTTFRNGYHIIPSSSVSKRRLSK